MARLYRIPEHDFVRATRALERSDSDALQQFARPLPVEFDRDLLTRVVDYAVEQAWDDPQRKEKSRTDAWLAPRIHAILRLPRRVASDRGIWFWLAATNMKRFVEYRFGERESAKNPWWRYNGELLRNAAARLWWGAELVRSGPDYRLVPEAFQSVRTFMFVSELRYSWDREAARAFTRVAAGLDGGCRLSDAAINELSKRFNTYLALDTLESRGIGFGQGGTSEWDRAWAEEIPSWLELSTDVSGIAGPAAGYSDPDREQALVDWLMDLASGVDLTTPNDEDTIEVI